MAALFQVLLAFTAVSTLFFLGTQSVTFTFQNRCPFTVWPGTLTNPGHPPLSSTGFELASNASSNLDVPIPWAGRVWGRSQCSQDRSGKFYCATGDCGSGNISCNGAGAIPPTTLAELAIQLNGGLDFYDISLVDGFNLPVSITPSGGYEGCNITSCPKNVNLVCPPELAVKGSTGTVISCKSACVAFSQPQYCCSGEFSTPDKCHPTNYSMIFKNECPQAYSYAYDDKTSTFTCNHGATYLITFCP